jgi:UDP-N-acetylmuramyl pentapeptide phosphotransferase/UDP-N-acetylglucosamine-1-phosphate transferase
MIGKAEWFRPRKYGGWGLSPASWQGWAYIGVLVVAMLGVQNLPLGDERLKTVLMLGLGIIFTADILDIMRKIKKDERELVHEAIAERNAMWFMVSVLALGVAYQAARSAVNNSVEVDPVILVALLGATVVKALSHWYLRDK